MRKQDKVLIQESRKRGRPLGSKIIQEKIKKRNLNGDAPVDTRFKSGKKPGPGRPLGSRSKFNMALEAVGEGNAILVYQRLVDLALGRTKDGDSTSCKIILDRVLPARKDRKIALDIHGAVNTPKEISALSTKVTAMMVTGEVTPGESIEIGNRLEQHLKVLTDVDIINKIEGTCKKMEGK